jgi:hypothetical protein
MWVELRQREYKVAGSLSQGLWHPPRKGGVAGHPASWERIPAFEGRENVNRGFFYVLMMRVHLIPRTHL